MTGYRSALRLLIPTLSAVWALAGCAASAPLAGKPQCTGNCTTHTEGYEWAQRADYADPAVCNGHVAEFAEGCRDGIEDRNQLRRGSRGF